MTSFNLRNDEEVTYNEKNGMTQEEARRSAERYVSCDTNKIVPSKTKKGTKKPNHSKKHNNFIGQVKNLNLTIQWDDL